MKKFSCILLSVVIFITTSFGFVFSASAANPVVSFTIDTVLSFGSSVFKSYSDSSAKKIEAARSFYFYLILDDYYESKITVCDETGTKFTDEILKFYYDYYLENSSSGYLHDIDLYNGQGDIFLQEAGFASTPWSLSLISFVRPPSDEVFGDYDTIYKVGLTNFSDYYQSYLIRYIQSQGGSATDPNPGKTGLEIAPGYTSGADLKEAVEIDNLVFSPKNATGKVTYWNDELYQAHYQAYPKSYPTYTNANFYTSYEFVATNSNDFYILLYYKMDDSVYYSKYQYHFYIKVVRDSSSSLTHTLYADVWDNAEQTKEEAATYSIDVSNYPHATLNVSGLYNDYFRGFESLANYKKNSGVSPDLPDGMELKTLLSPDLTQSLYAQNVYTHFGKSYEEHKATCTADCDYGYIASVSPIVMRYDIDSSKIPDDAIITVGGDNIYNYYITNPDTGESSTMNEYITNNYTYITNNNGGESGGSSGGSVGGNVTVGGEIAVGGQVGVDITVSVPDININVNGNGAGGTEVTPNPDDFLGDSEVDLTSYYDKAVEDASGVRQFLGTFFDFLPAELLGLLCLLVAVAICCRIFGR